MKEEMVRKLFEILYPKLEIVSIEFLPRQKLNENNEWVKDSSAIFIGVKYAEEANFDSIREYNGVTNFLTNLTGFEFNVFIS